MEHCSGNRSSSSTASSTDKFYAMTGTTQPFDPRKITDAASEGECEQAYLSYCSCTAYSFGSGAGCSVWHGDLLNLKQVLKDGATSNGEIILYIRLAAKEFQARRNDGVTIAGIIIAVSSASLGILALIVILKVRRNKKRLHCRTVNNIHVGGGLVPFRYSELQRATRNFSDKIGAGGFGAVFKGSLNESTAIAVKRLRGSCHEEKQFRAELRSIGIIHHTNLVRMIGFCCEGNKRLLVYEHMPNLSLDVHLFRNNASTLNWNTRYQIALGVARGLAYLHESCQDYIMHCDIKPQNILLDRSFVHKIADFGMAKLLKRDYSRVMTTTRETIEYLAPEWISGVAILHRKLMYIAIVWYC